MKPASLILAAVASPLVLVTAQPTPSNASVPSIIVPSSTSHEGITIAGECSWYGGINGWYYNSWSSGPYACYGAIGERWTMRRAYRSGGTENVHWKYTNDPNDPACMNDWAYYAEDVTTLIAEIRGRTTLIADPRYWCALPVYRSGGVEDRHWNVHVPYCTGDLHIGNTVLDPYESGIEPVFGHPQCLGLQKKTHLNGFDNTKAAFQWAKINYPEVEELVFGGMSAGSLASQILAAYAADLWSVQAKDVKYGVLADSYIGVLPENRPAGQVLNFYGACDVDLKVPTSVSAKCKAETLSIPEYSSAGIGSS